MNVKLKSKLYEKISEWVVDCADQDEIWGSDMVHPKLEEMLTNACEVVFDTSVGTSRHCDENTQK